MSSHSGDRNTWKCTGCGTINSEKYCRHCGQERPAEQDGKRCRCGQWNDKQAKFCSQCGRKLNRISGKRIFAVALVMILLVLAAVNMHTKTSGKDTQTGMAVSQKTTAEDHWRKNLLMRDKVDTVAPLGGFRSSIVTEPVFGSDRLMRTDICRVIFEDTVQNAPEDHWDVSDAQDRSVLAWAIPAEDGLYELHIAAEGGINGKLACEDLFCGYQNVTSIAFNDCFHTEEAEDFSRMFYYCWQLETVDLSGIRTDSATNLSEMFANCFSLAEIDVSAFDTSDVEDTSGMFSSCMALQTVDIRNFDMLTVRDVSYMFYQCPAGEGLQMGQDEYWFRNVDRYENFMDEGVLVDGKPWICLFEAEAVPEMQKEPAIAVGDIVVFGSYEQDNLQSNGPEAVQWLVLDVRGDKALLLSRDALDSRPYHDATASVTWETSSLRKWLNGEFLNTAFSGTERELIQLVEVDNGKTQGNSNWNTDGGNNTYDSVFLLSYAEAERYFGNERSRICSPTDYAVNMGADTRAFDQAIPDAGWWWLRSPGEKDNHAAFVNFDGAKYSNMVSNGYLSVRPAMWVDISKAVSGN